MRINPGKLREVVQLQQLVTATDAVGNQTADWQTAATLRCRVNSLYGEDYWAAAAQNQQDTLVFVLRWCPVLAAAMADGDLTRWRLQLGRAAYEIRSFDDVDFAHKLVKLRAVRQ